MITNNYHLKKALDALYLAYDICEYSIKQKFQVASIIDQSIATNKQIDYATIYSIKKLDFEQKQALQYAIQQVLDHI